MIFTIFHLTAIKIKCCIIMPMSHKFTWWQWFYLDPLFWKFAYFASLILNRKWILRRRTFPQCCIVLLSVSTFFFEHTRKSMTILLADSTNSEIFNLSSFKFVLSFWNGVSLSEKQLFKGGKQLIRWDEMLINYRNIICSYYCLL